MNEWVSDSGDALEAADIEAAAVLQGPAASPDPDSLYVAGLDLGVKHDRSAFVVLGTRPGSGTVQLARCESWAPKPGGEVDLSVVERAVLQAVNDFGILVVCFDPHQAVHMAQRLRLDGVSMTEVPFVGRNLDAMARDLLTAFRGRRIQLYGDRELLDDLRRLQVVPRRFGFKLEAVADETGHADRAIALAIALPEALSLSEADNLIFDEEEQLLPMRVFS